MMIYIVCLLMRLRSADMALATPRDGVYTFIGDPCSPRRASVGLDALKEIELLTAR